MKISMVLICFAFAKAVTAQTPPPSPDVLKAFKAEVFEHKGRELPYRILLPTDFDPAEKYPLHLFLHGAGERGNDNESQLIHGGDLFLKMNKEYPAIVIFPQCPTEDYWADVNVTRDRIQNVFTFPENPRPTWVMSALLALLDTQLKNTYIDRSRVYLGGLSMGGMGTFELLYHRPKTFAAATAICGAGYPALVESWSQHTDIWIFHGEDDPVVPSIYSQLMVEALLKNEAAPRASFYPKIQHDSWTTAFAENDFFSWIYSRSKKQNPVITTDEVCPPQWLQFSEEVLIGKFNDQNEALSIHDSAQRIVFMGDSITEGWPEASPTFWENHPSFINRGVSGQTTPQMLVRFRQDVIALQPKTVVILAGTNDIAGNTGKTSIETIANNIYTMADLAKQHHIKVIISSVLPVYDYPWKTGLQPASQITALNTMLKSYSLKEGHTYIDYHTAMKNDREGMQEKLSYDGVHCTKEGYKKMEPLLMEVLGKR